MNAELLTIQQLSEAINLGRTKIYSLINNGEIQAVKVGKKTLVSREALNDFLNSLPSYHIKN